jgi:hypothetical protein
VERAVPLCSAASNAATASCLGLVWEPETLWDLLIRAFCSVRKGTAVSQGNDNFFRFVC